MSFKPDAFSLSPLVSILPSAGRVARLEESLSSLFARHETIQSAIRREENDSSNLQVEEAMLREILAWLSVELDLGDEQ